MAFINYGAGPRVVNEGGHVVYSRASWAASWVEVPNLKALECQWNAAPAMNTALLRWDAGAIILPGDTLPTLFGPWIGRGHFIRIDWTCDDGSILRWVGFVDQSEWPTEAFGSQTIVCYGLEQALAKTPIYDAAWRDIDRASTDDPKPPIVRRSGLPLTFNSPTGMRSFDPVEEDGDLYAFASPTEENPKKWSTREIVRYLMNYHLPTNSLGVTAVPWSVDQIDLLPDWDSPTVETRNRTLWDVLNELLSPEQQLGFTVGSNGTTVYLRCFTHLASTFTIGSRSIAANPNQHTLWFGPDALTESTLSDVGGGYDQVLVRGARRQTICTLTHAGGELVNDWTESLEDQYEVGASADVDYAGFSFNEKRQRNAAVRGRPLLSSVFRKFKVDPDWDGEIGGEAVFVGNEFPRSLRILPRLPIKPNIEWHGAVNQDHFDRAGEGRPLLCVWDDPTDNMEWVDNAAIEQLSALLGSQLEDDFTVRPRVNERTVELIVDGGPQHLIASDEYDTVDGVFEKTHLAFTSVELTVAIEEDRYCQGMFPLVAPSADIVRRLVVDLGDGYHRIAIHPSTVTSLTKVAGEKELSSGGTLVDDSPQLQALAQVIAQSVLLTRKTVQWSSLRKISTVAVGDLIVAAAGQSVVAPVMAVHIRGGVSINSPAGATMQAFEVYRGTMDALSVVRRLGGAQPGVKKR